MITRTLDIDVLGELRTGGHASAALHVTIGDQPFQEHFDDPTNIDEVWSYVNTHTDDFAEVYAINTVYTEVGTVVTPVQEAGNQRTWETRLVTRQITIIA